MKPSDTKIAFVGLGLMGVPMAKNLLKAGFQIAGFDLNKEVAEKFSGEKGFQFVFPYGNEKLRELIDQFFL